VPAENQLVSPERAALANAAGTSDREAFVLALNAGSSSLKFGLFRLDTSPTRILSGVIDRIGSREAAVTLRKIESGQTEEMKISAPNQASGLNYLLERIEELTGPAGIRAAGHRIVHGGAHYTQPQPVTPEMMTELQRLTPFAPEHLPAELALITAMRERFPSLPQVVCFDTAFHRDLPRVARILAIPRRYEKAGVRRYGFHGLSYEFLMEELARLGDPTASKGRAILAHLGNGASLAAVCDGRSIDTSMSLTPAAGLVMSTRAGDLDPGLPSFLERTEGMSAAQFHQMVNHESGLFGVSEISSDLRDLLAREGNDVRAREAVALFCYQAKKWIGSFAAALGGLDTLIFAGGIGENAPQIRLRICDGLSFLGIELDAARNAKSARQISNDKSRVVVRVIRTDEELMIARAVIRILDSDSDRKG
jgi:acetate kinase